MRYLFQGFCGSTVLCMDAILIPFLLFPFLHILPKLGYFACRAQLLLIRSSAEFGSAGRRASIARFLLFGILRSMGVEYRRGLPNASCLVIARKTIPAGSGH